MNFTLSFLLLKLAVQVPAEQCITPDKNEGECKSLYSCPDLIAALATHKSEEIEFVRKSNCGGTAVDPKICCRRPPKLGPEECATPDKNEGECKSLYECPDLIAAIATQLDEEIEFVRKSNCGGTELNPKVCCRLMPKLPPGKCMTPDNKEGECKSLYRCPDLLTALASQQSETFEFVRKSNCGGTKLDPKVCCGFTPILKTTNSENNSTKSLSAENNNTKTMAPDNITTISENNSTRLPGENNIKSVLAENKTTTAHRTRLLSDRHYCGFQHSDDYFHLENNDTLLDEFPWLVFFTKQRQDGSTFYDEKCAGALINNRYVLSEKLCSGSQSDFSVVSVRLGDHYLNRDMDCVEDSPLNECSLPYEEVPIESVITYSGSNTVDFRAINVDRRYEPDLALIRLSRKIEYTDYIRPICLTQPSTAAKLEDTLVLPGWDTGDEGFVKGFKKIRTQRELVNNKLCSATSLYFAVTDNHLCTRTIFGSVSEIMRHPFIYGAPLSFSVRSQWQLEGISTFGIGELQTYIKVANYIEWIEKNVKV